MWWSKPVLVAVLLSLGLTGCGFRPLYGRTEAGTDPMAEQLASVRVLGIEDRNGQMLRNALLQQLNPRGEPGRPTYALEVRSHQNLAGLASTEDGKASIGSLDYTANFRLIDIEKGDVVHSGTARSITGIRFLGPRYGSVASERDAEERAISDIALQIRTRLAAYLKGRE